MAKLTLQDITSGYAAPAKYNANNTAIEAAIENTLSRDGTEPNQMEAALDMNSNLIINLGPPVNNNDAARLQDIIDASDPNASTAVLTSITDSGGYYSSDNVEGALQEVGNQIFFDSRLEVSEPYKRTDSEISNAVVPVRLLYKPGDVRRYCSSSETNHQQAFTDALTCNSVVYVPAGTWNVDHFLVDIDNRSILTDGFSTIIHQRTGNINRRIIEICASNVTVGDLKLTGNIGTDTGEQQHGIFVSGDHPSLANRNITNIRLGNVLGQDIRGDVVYLGAPAGSTTTGVSWNVIIGTNIYRNVVSVVGACQYYGVGVWTNGNGYAAMDVEPNVGGVATTDGHVHWVRGGVLQIAPPTSATKAERITFGTVDLNPTYQPNSTPGYSEGGSNYTNQIKSALWLRNTIGLKIDYLKVRDHSEFAINYIFNVGETKGKNIHLGYIDFSGVGAAESTINAAINGGNIESMVIDDGDVTLQSVGDYLIAGNAADKNTRVIVNKLRINGTVQRFGRQCRYSDIERVDSNNSHTFRDIDGLLLSNSRIDTTRLFSNVTAAKTLASNVTCSTSYLSGTCTNLSFDQCYGGLATFLQGSTTYDPPSLADGAGVTTTVTCTGAALGDFAEWSFDQNVNGITVTAWVSATDTVSVRFQNETTGVMDLNSGTLRVKCRKP